MNLLGKLAGAGLCAAAFLINPLVFTACSGDGYTYDEDDMSALVDSLNEQKTWSFDSYELELELHRPQSASNGIPSAPFDVGHTLISSAHACGTREFKLACIDSTNMAVSGTMSVFSMDGGERTLVSESTVQGALYVWSLNLSAAELDLSFDEGILNMQWHEDEGDEFELEEFHADKLGDDETSIDYSSTTR